VSQVVRRAPRSIAAARAQMFGAYAGSPDDMQMVRHRLDLPAGVAGRVEQLFGASLHVIDQSATDVVTRVLVAGAAVGLSVLGGIVALLAVGVLPVSPVWLAAPVIAAALAGWTMVLDTRSRIARRRREFRQAANDFVQLVAVGLTTDQSVEEAIRFALDVGGGPSFETIRRSVLAAPQRGVPVWEAIDAVGTAYDVRELTEFATSVERQGLQGVSIGSTVATLAEAMRARALDQLERDADRANANLAGPTIGFVVTTIVFLAYPLALRISEAFGG
jgi:Flp pilus assembly protein TadB